MEESHIVLLYRVVLMQWGGQQYSLITAARLIHTYMFHLFIFIILLW